MTDDEKNKMKINSINNYNVFDEITRKYVHKILNHKALTIEELDKVNNLCTNDRFIVLLAFNDIVLYSEELIDSTFF
jgi:hypothetical protein